MSLKKLVDLELFGRAVDKLKAILAPRERGIEYIRGTWTAASGTWTGVSQDTELYDGKQILLYMPFAGSGNATLNLTLANGKATGAKNVYFESATRFTTHKGQNSQLHLIYHKAHRLSNGTSYEGWWYVANRDTNTTYGTVSKSAAGLTPALPNETATTKFLRQDGTWAVPAGGGTSPAIYTATIPTSGWTDVSGGVEKTITFSNVTFTADGPVFLDLNLTNDTDADSCLENWDRLIRATPVSGTGNMRVLMLTAPDVSLPVRIIKF